MLRKTIILSLFLLVTGFALLGWIFLEQRRHQRIEQDKQRRLERQVGRLTEMVDEQADIHSFEDVVSSESYQERRWMRNETKELLVTVSNVLTLSGGSVLCLCLLIGASRVIAKGIGRLSFSKAQIRENAAEQKQVRGRIEEDKKTDSVVLTHSGWSNGAGANAGKRAPQRSLGNYSKGITEGVKEIKKGLFAPQGINGNETNDYSSSSVDTSLLLCDEGEEEAPSENESVTQTIEEFASGDELNENSDGPVDTISTQTRDLEDQMARLEQMASGKSRVEDSKPLQESLMELTQQISAIREYASHQQERVQKLQDGYDWSIIKNFCLRIIRCIDNVEDRIQDQSSQQSDTKELEEVRDELVFALESTGVEQFNPEINSEYRGQERNTEAVKEKKECKDEKLSGRIAEVIRPGYWFCVDEDNMKVVRVAQVKLYGGAGDGIEG